MQELEGSFSTFPQRGACSSFFGRVISMQGGDVRVGVGVQGFRGLGF